MGLLLGSAGVGPQAGLMLCTWHHGAFLLAAPALDSAQGWMPGPTAARHLLRLKVGPTGPARGHSTSPACSSRALAVGQLLAALQQQVPVLPARLLPPVHAAGQQRAGRGRQ